MAISVFVKEILKDLRENPTNWKRKDSWTIVNYDMHTKVVFINNIGSHPLFSVIDVQINNNFIHPTTYLDNYLLEKECKKWSRTINLENI